MCGIKESIELFILQIICTDNLCRELLRYCMEIECSSGVIFSGREKGSPITPGAVWGKV